MDTIIYLYRWSKPEKWNDTNLQNLPAAGIQELYCLEDHNLLDYRLVKVGMHTELLRICDENSMAEKENHQTEQGGFFARRRIRKKQLREREMLTEFLRSLPEIQKGSSIVCREPISYFAGLEFNGYFQAAYVRHLLRYAKDLSHFMILGPCYCISEILYENVRDMKSLKWILYERHFREEQEELVDTLYEEYGLAVDVRLLSETESFAKAHPTCKEPVVVLDFCEEDRIPTVDVVRGSIWLDMASSEEKRRRIEDRDTGISYFSLKKEWKEPQKALNYLDTISKNGYNT